MENFPFCSLRFLLSDSLNFSSALLKLAGARKPTGPGFDCMSRRKYGEAVLLAGFTWIILVGAGGFTGEPDVFGGLIQVLGSASIVSGTGHTLFLFLFFDFFLFYWRCFSR